MGSLQAKFNFTLTPEELEGYVKEEENRVVEKLEAKAEPCIGVMAELEKLHAQKKYEVAVVSSSALRRVRASIKKVAQEKYFPHDLVFSAATSLDKPTTKPDPAIYLHTLKFMKKQAAECIAIEDSKSGALSAIRANIPVIAYVGSYNGAEKQTEMAKALLDLGAKVVMRDWTEFEKCIAEVESGNAQAAL